MNATTDAEIQAYKAKNAKWIAGNLHFFGLDNPILLEDDSALIEAVAHHIRTAPDPSSQCHELLCLIALEREEIQHISEYDDALPVTDETVLRTVAAYLKEQDDPLATRYTICTHIAEEKALAWHDEGTDTAMIFTARHPERTSQSPRV